MVTIERKLFYAYQRARKALGQNEGLGATHEFAHAQAEFTVYIDIRRNPNVTSVRDTNKTP